MGATIIEKIVANHSDQSVSPGDIVWMRIDVRTARDFGGANVIEQLEAEVADHPVKDKDHTFFTFDCNAPANTIGYAENQMRCRFFAADHKIKVYDVDRGIGSHALIEEGLALPGQTLVGTDSHLNILGSVGCLGLGMGDTDVAFAFASGKTWFEVPPTVKINIVGDLPKGCSARDLTLFLVGKLGSKGLLGKAAEYYGPAIEKLTLAGRIALASMATEMGGVITFIPPSKEILDYIEKHKQFDYEPVNADPDAKYCEELTFDISNLTPQIACPHKPDNVKPVSEVQKERVIVHSVFIGSCSNGQLEDMIAAANILKGKRVEPGLMCKIVPATQEVYGEMIKLGLLEVFFKAGALISNPGCGGCASGQIGMTGKGEVQVSTSNRNFKGKQGNGATYLASPETAAWTALKGYICNFEV